MAIKLDLRELITHCTATGVQITTQTIPRPGMEETHVMCAACRAGISTRHGATGHLFSSKKNPELTRNPQSAMKGYRHVAKALASRAAIRCPECGHVAGHPFHVAKAEANVTQWYADNDMPLHPEVLETEVKAAYDHHMDWQAEVHKRWSAGEGCAAHNNYPPELAELWALNLPRPIGTNPAPKPKPRRQRAPKPTTPAPTTSRPTHTSDRKQWEAALVAEQAKLDAEREAKIQAWKATQPPPKPPRTTRRWWQLWLLLALLPATAHARPIRLPPLVVHAFRPLPVSIKLSWASQYQDVFEGPCVGPLGYSPSCKQLQWTPWALLAADTWMLVHVATASTWGELSRYHGPLSRQLMYASVRK